MSYDSKLRTPTQLSKFMQDFEYKDFDRLMFPEEVYLTKSGSCHDQALFEMVELIRIGMHPKAKFIMAVDKDNIGGETHSFVYWTTGNRTYWFENAWEEHRGINIFSSEQDMLDTVIEEFKARNPHQYIFLGDFNLKDHILGEDLQTFVDICMNNAIQV